MLPEAQHQLLTMLGAGGDAAVQVTGLPVSPCTLGILMGGGSKSGASSSFSRDDEMMKRPVLLL